MYLNEEIFDDVFEIKIPSVSTEFSAEEITATGPAPGIDTGLTDLILSLINDENEAIQGYNSFKASLEGHDDFISVIDDIANEEMNHVGMLQALLAKISPNAQTIEDGKLEAEQSLSEAFVEKDFSDIPLVKHINFRNASGHTFPGIYPLKSFIKALEDTGYNKFKIRTSTINISVADINDDYLGIRKNGWHIERAYDKSLPGFNEIYICSKTDVVESFIPDTYYDDTFNNGFGGVYAKGINEDSARSKFKRT